MHIRSITCILSTLLLASCEYACGIGYLANEYRKEKAEEQRKLEECGTCAEGERCNLLLDPAQCRPKRGVEGDPCGDWLDRNDPQYKFGCEPPLVCNEALEPATCAPLGAVGTPCHHEGHCVADAYCHEWKCVPSLPLGAACVFDETCRPNTCLDATNTCEVLRGVDEACSSAQDCGPALACSDAKRCYDPLPAQP